MTARAVARLAGAVLLVAAIAPTGPRVASGADALRSGTTFDAASTMGVHRLGIAPRAAEGDTTIDGFLRQLSDSTDSYFGMSAAPLDTTGLDSARVWSLLNPGRERGTGELKPRFAPTLSFNRVDGPVYGVTTKIGWPRRKGRLAANVAYAAGPNDWMGFGQYSKVFRRGNTEYETDLWGGRESANMDRDRGDFYLASLRAFINGYDSRNYFRREGARFSARRIGTGLQIGFGARDQLELPQVTTTTWNLFNWEPQRIDNLPSAEGRAIELSTDVLWRVPHTPLAVAGAYVSSSRALNSDFEYRRSMVAGGADIGVGRKLSIVPQLMYGSLTGDAIPQEMFYIGGPRTLHSVPTQSLGGTRTALARVDVIGIPDLLAILHVPHPDAFPIQGGLFAGIGAAWGPDPFGGPDRGGGDWPDVEEWKSEAGFSLLYQPGLPDPLGFIKLSFAWALGPEREEDRFSVSYSRAFDLLRPFDR